MLLTSLYHQKKKLLSNISGQKCQKKNCQKMTESSDVALFHKADILSSNQTTEPGRPWQNEFYTHQRISHLLRPGVKVRKHWCTEQDNKTHLVYFGTGVFTVGTYVDSYNRIPSHSPASRAFPRYIPSSHHKANLFPMLPYVPAAIYLIYIIFLLRG